MSTDEKATQAPKFSDLSLEEMDEEIIRQHDRVLSMKEDARKMRLARDAKSAEMTLAKKLREMTPAELTHLGALIKTQSIGEAGAIKTAEAVGTPGK